MLLFTKAISYCWWRVCQNI